MALNRASDSLGKAVTAIVERLNVETAEAQMIVAKAIQGGETTDTGAFEWYQERLLPNLVFIDEPGYAAMCIDALKIVSTTAGTDFGSSRQRDLSQQWADMTRGYLGEYAFKLFLQKKGISASLGHEVGTLAQYLPMDIHSVHRSGEEWRPPRVAVGVKTTKWNGIWMDIPGDQFSHSKVHVLVKVGTGRDHLLAFLKELSVFRDKVLKRGEDVGVLTSAESVDLFTNLPSFRSIPAYICGFVDRDETYLPRVYTGKKGRIKFTIQSWRGPISSGDLQIIAKEQGVQPGKVSFESIGEFAHDNGYLFNTGSLRWGADDWSRLIEAL